MSRLALVVLLLCAVPAQAFAWVREPYEDADVVSRSELVIVGHLKPGSVQRVDHPRSDGGGASWEHHATLVITDTLKGKAAAAEIPVIIHYGLEPVLDGKTSNVHATISLWGGPVPPATVPIVDTGNSMVGGPPIVADATSDNVWFLRRRAGIYGREPGHGELGIVDPEDLRPLADKDYLALYLGATPEAAVTAYATTHTSPAASRYVDHLDIQHILALTDPKARVDKLVPYFLRHARWGLHDEAMDGIVKAGAGAAGPRLVAMFATADREARSRIISTWGRLGYHGAVDTLVALLVASDQFWAAQQLTPEWWNTAPDSALTTERRARYSDVYDSVLALGQIHDRKAEPALRLTLKRWQASAFFDSSMVDACQTALAAGAK